MSSLPAVYVVRGGRDRPSNSVVRRTPCSEVSGSGKLSASGSGSRGDEAERVGLAEARAGKHVFDEAPEPLILRQASEHGALGAGA